MNKEGEIIHIISSGWSYNEPRPIGMALKLEEAKSLASTWLEHWVD